METLLANCSVRPWDVFVPEFHRKHTNKQCTWNQKQTNNLPGIFESHSLADFWDLAVLVQWWKRPKNKHDNTNIGKHRLKKDQVWDLWTLMISIQWWPPALGTCRPASPPHRLAFFPGQSRPPSLNKGHFSAFFGRIFPITRLWRKYTFSQAVFNRTFFHLRTDTFVFSSRSVVFVKWSIYEQQQTWNQIYFRTLSKAELGMIWQKWG